MNTLRNKVSLIGRVSTILDTVNGVVQFSVGTLENKRTDDGGYRTEQVDHVIQASGSITRRLHLIEKGVEVIVEGRLVHAKYKTPKGAIKFGTIIELNDFLILKPKSN